MLLEVLVLAGSRLAQVTVFLLEGEGQSLGNTVHVVVMCYFWDHLNSTEYLTCGAFQC